MGHGAAAEHVGTHYSVGDLGQSILSALEDSGANLDSLLAAVGFKEVVWNDLTKSSVAFWRKRLATDAESGPPPLGIHLLMGEDAAQKAKNVLRNLEEERITVVQAVVERP